MLLLWKELKTCILNYFCFLVNSPSDWAFFHIRNVLFFSFKIMNLSVNCVKLLFKKFKIWTETLPCRWNIHYYVVLCTDIKVVISRPKQMTSLRRSFNQNWFWTLAITVADTDKANFWNSFCCDVWITQQCHLFNPPISAM